MRIYTRTGDKGETGLVGGSRVRKDDSRIASIGEVDELNSALGLARVESVGTLLEERIATVQNWIFDLGAELATPAESTHENSSIGSRQSAQLEQWMDEQTAQLPQLRNFILPGGSRLAAQLHFARSVCRRAERQVLTFSRQQTVRSEVTAFLNRLSDWLFVSARTANALVGVKDIEWSK